MANKAIGASVATKGGSRPYCTQTFTASGTFTWPVGVQTVEALLVGGGGRGGSSGGSSGGGGAGGQVVVGTVSRPASGVSAVTVGAGDPNGVQAPYQGRPNASSTTSITGGNGTLSAFGGTPGGCHNNNKGNPGVLGSGASGSNGAGFLEGGYGTLLNGGSANFDPGAAGGGAGWGGSGGNGGSGINSTGGAGGAGWTAPALFGGGTYAGGGGGGGGISSGSSATGGAGGSGGGGAGGNLNANGANGTANTGGGGGGGGANGAGGNGGNGGSGIAILVWSQ